ncbi:unnamed protein product [Rotaria sordida]|uniref:Uncharacterized protein n=1 Tax=Rotaria sordida TaxID=392033 RepID=A0A814H6N8_9BILA|nr:unnamed protein product [Rotaria sordida]
MGSSASLGSIGKQVCISLRGLSHEVCVAATRAEYWRQLVQNSSISIRGTGSYVPVKLQSMCNDQDESRLQLIINSQAEQDNQQIDDIYNRIRSDLTLFEQNDAPVYNYDNREVTVFGSLFNSLPMDTFNPDLHILGPQQCNSFEICVDYIIKFQSQSLYDSDQSDDDDDDEIIPDDIREQQRQAAQRLLNLLCARMQTRAPKDTLEEAHEDPTTIKSFFVRRVQQQQPRMIQNVQYT